MAKSSSNKVEEKKTVKFDDLNDVQRTQYLFKQCESREQFQRWIKTWLHVDLPDCTVSRYSDTNPLDVCWEIYNICVNKTNPEHIEELLCVAGRGSGKTLGMAVVEFAVLLHDIRSIVHVGATQGQADRCYSLVQGFILNNRLQNIIYPKGIPEAKRIVTKLTISETAIRVNGQKATLEVLPCTLKALNGPHVPLIVVDEIDTVSGEGVKAFKEISGMLDSRGDKKALRVGISTRKSQHGLMNQQIETANECGVHLRKWTCFEFCQACTEEMSGTIVTDLWVDVYGYRVLPTEKYELLDEKEQGKFVYVSFPGEKCAKCALAPICQGDAKKQVSKSKFLKPLSDIIKKVKKEGPDWTLSQLMNLKPSLEGVVFKEFNEDRHVITFNEAWVVLTGKQSPVEITKKRFISQAKSIGCQIYCGVDFGWSAPSTATFVIKTPDNNFIVAGTHGLVDTSKPNWLLALKQKYQPIYKADSYFIDTADPGDMVTANEVGLSIGNKSSKKYSREYGVQIIKKLLFSLNSPVPNLYFIKDETKDIVREMKTFHYKIGTDGEPTDVLDDENDHWIDGLRYVLADVSGGVIADLNIGAAQEVSYTANIRGLGTKSEPKTLSEIYEEEEREEVCGGGNFWFSF